MVKIVIALLVLGGLWLAWQFLGAILEVLGDVAEAVVGCANSDMASDLAVR